MRRVVLLTLAVALAGCAGYLRGWKGPPDRGEASRSFCEHDITILGDDVQVCLVDENGTPWARPLTIMEIYIPEWYLRDEIAKYGFSRDTLEGACAVALRRVEMGVFEPSHTEALATTCSMILLYELKR